MRVLNVKERVIYALAKMYAEVGRRGLAIPLAQFRERVGGDRALKKILAALTVTEKVHPGKPRGMARTIRRAYAIERVRAQGGVPASETLYLPRIKGPPFMRAKSKAGLPLLDGIRPAPADSSNAPLSEPRRIDPDRCEPEQPLYEYQEAAIEHLCGTDGPFGPASVAKHLGVSYLQMDTGLGKTRVGCGVVARRGEPALVVVPTDAIAVQWVDEFSEIYPAMSVKIYRNPPKKSRKIPPNPQSHDVILIIVNTFRNKTPDFMDGFGTVILDEAHEYHSTHNSRALWLSQTNAVLGLSATPEERPDGTDRYVHLHLGPILYPKNIPGFDVLAVSFRGAARVIEYTGHPAHSETATTPAGTMSAILTIGNVIKDPARLRLIASEVSRLYLLHDTAAPDELLALGLGPRPADVATEKHPVGGIRRHGVFVFAEHRDYLPILRAALLEYMNPDEILAPELPAVSILRGGVAKTAVGDAKRAGSHVVLTTYGFSRRGISLPDMTAIVKATPRRNGTRQILGRILRRGSDESIVRQIVDVVDVCTGLRSQATDRRKIYAEREYELTKVSASWENYAQPGVAPVLELEDAPEDALAEMTVDELLAAAMGTAAPGTAPSGTAPSGPLPDVSALVDDDIDALLAFD